MGRLRRLSRGGRFLLAIVAAGAVFGIVSAVQAAIPDSNSVIHGCYQYTTTNGNYGKLRVFDAAKGGGCNSLEKPVNWNQRGVTGPTGPPGPGATGPNTYMNTGAPNTVISNATPTVMASLSLPAGSYALDGSGWVETQAAVEQEGACYIVINNAAPVDGADPTARFEINDDTDNETESISLTGATTQATAFTADLVCLGDADNDEVVDGQGFLRASTATIVSNT